MFSDGRPDERRVRIGVPLIYTLDADSRVVEAGYLGDPDEIAAAEAAVAAQGSAESTT